MWFWGRRFNDWAGDLQWTALYTNSSRKCAARRPSSPQPSKGSLRLRLNWPSWTGSSKRPPNPLSRIGCPSQDVAPQGGGRLADLPPRFFETSRPMGGALPAPRRGSGRRAAIARGYARDRPVSHHQEISKTVKG